jgi:hypothetical protein
MYLPEWFERGNKYHENLITEAMSLDMPDVAVSSTDSYFTLAYAVRMLKDSQASSSSSSRNYVTPRAAVPSLHHLTTISYST